MKAIKKLLNTTPKIIGAIVVVLLLVFWAVLFVVATPFALALVKPVLITVLVLTISWIAIHYGVKAWRKRKRSEFDEAIAAKEGIDDRKREWAQWTEELDKRNIDRYELPFYLLVGEPQSGKSVLLHNSDLHFPFGQNRLSGVGGTRGCDWWFTEEAVILDLAGRLFTHEGGAADRLEFEAFLKLLYEFRPLCPANGVILVVPCDSLLKDSEEVSATKATKIQNALLTLTTQLQAQIPVYLVLTKGDQIFGFAESVHRLDVEHRHQMFGWSRPAAKIDSPFDVAEASQGFDELVKRARHLRAHMLAGARLPEALPEVDRLFAFPHEFAGMKPNLEIYLKRIFTASNVTDRVFFRGLYLTSGLQSGVPIAKVCTELYGQAGEADKRDLEALFSKPKAYFIKDLVRTRIFGERGLVRPTQGRVQQTRRTSAVAYGFAGLLMLLSLLFGTVYLARGTEDASQKIRTEAIQAATLSVEDQKATVQDLLWRLQQVAEAADLRAEAAEQAFGGSREEFEKLYRSLFDQRFTAQLRREALNSIEAKLTADRFVDHDDLARTCAGLTALLDEVDFSDDDAARDVGACLPVVFNSGRTMKDGSPPMSVELAFKRRASLGNDSDLRLPVIPAEEQRLVKLATLAVGALDRCIEMGSTTQPRGQLGFMVAWYGANEAHDAIVSSQIAQARDPIELAHAFASAVAAMKSILEVDLAPSRTISLKDTIVQARGLESRRRALVGFLGRKGKGSTVPARWTRMENIMPFVGEKVAAGDATKWNISSFGAHFGDEDFGQNAFQSSESMIATVTGEFTVPTHHDPLGSVDGFGAEPVLMMLCQSSLPLDVDGRGLAGLARKIEELDTQLLIKESVGTKAFDLFLSQCLEAGRRFQATLRDAAAVERAMLGTQVAQPKGSLCIELVEELAALHRVVGALIAKRELGLQYQRPLDDWRTAIESILHEHFDACTSVQGLLVDVTADGTFADPTWRLLRGLAEAARLRPVRPERYPANVLAARLLGDLYFAQAARLDERWIARGADALAPTIDTVRELSGLCTRTRQELGDTNVLSSSGPFESWSLGVDDLVADRLETILVDVHRLWLPTIDSVSFRVSVTQARTALGSIQEKLEESQRLGLASLPLIANEFQENGPIRAWLGMKRSSIAAADLAQCRLPTDAGAVQRHGDYGALMGSLEDLLEANPADKAFGELLATTYAARYSATVMAADKAPTNAGLRLVSETKKALAAILAREIRGAYLKELKDSFERPAFEPLFDVLFWHPGDDISNNADGTVRDALANFMNRTRGEFDKLRTKYRLIGADPIGAAIFPRDVPIDEPWARCHVFLEELQEFLLGKDVRTVTEAKFSFWITPKVGDASSVWDLGAGAAAERRDFFYFPASDSKADLQSQHMSSLGRLAVANWGFDVNRDNRSVLFLWSSMPAQDKARVDPNRFSYEVRSCLAPLLLAWSGSLVDPDDPTIVDVTFTPKGSQRAAPMRLEFDRAVPTRPTRP